MSDHTRNIDGSRNKTCHKRSQGSRRSTSNKELKTRLETYDSNIQQVDESQPEAWLVAERLRSCSSAQC